MRNILLFFITILPISAFSQKVDFNSAMEDGILAIAEVRLNDLENILKMERRTNPDNVVPDYLESAALSIRAFFVEDEAWLESKEERLDALFERVSNLPDSEPYKNVFLAEMSLGIAGAHGKFKHNVKAAWAFYKAYNLLSDNLEEHPHFIPTLIPFGVLQTAVGALPSDYKSIASLFGFEGNIEAGLKMIRKAYYYSLADPKLKFHQNYFAYVYSYVNFELDTDEQVSLHTLGINVEGSTFFVYLEAQQLLSQGDANASLELLLKRPQGPSYLTIPFFNYYTGKVALMVDREEAKKQLERFLKESRDNEHRKSAYRYLAWYHLLKGEDQAAEAYRQKILTEPTTITGSDKQALVEAKRGFNPYLIKARLNFDAGRYARVVQDLKPGIINRYCKEAWEFQEYHYRRARALQELGLSDEAIKSFNESIKYQLPVSFSLANSTLQLALLFEEKGNWSKSRELFKAALVLEDYPFHEGIQQKAKAGLARLP